MIRASYYEGMKSGGMTGTTIRNTMETNNESIERNFGGGKSLGGGAGRGRH